MAFGFIATKAAIHKVSLTSSDFDFDLLSSEDCSDITATQNGVLIPAVARPDSSKSSETATVYVRTAGAGNVFFGAGVSRFNSGVPSDIAAVYTETTFSCSHSGAVADNPLTSNVHFSGVYTGSFGGANYWAAVTPWGGAGWPASNRYEDPCIFSSADGVTWSEVNVNASGFADIFDAYAEDVNSFSSDCNLIFDSSALYCYFRNNDATTEELRRMQSTNGTTWTDSLSSSGDYDTLVITATQTPLSGRDDLVSPSVIKIGSTYYLFTTSVVEAEDQVRVRKFTGTDGLNFTERAEGYLDNWWPADFAGPWHSEVRYDEDNEVMVMIHMLTRDGVENADGFGLNSGFNFLSYSYDFGETWVLAPHPVYTTSGDADYRKMYKAGIFKSAAGWRIAPSYSKATDWGIAVSGDISLDFSRAKTRQNYDGVFLGAQFYKPANASNPADDTVLTTWPPCRKFDGVADIASNVLTQTRDGAAGDIIFGDDLGDQTIIEFRCKFNGTSASIAIGATGLSGSTTTGMAYGTNAGGADTVKVHVSGTDADSGSSLTQDTDWHVYRIEINGGAYTIYQDDVQVHTFTFAAQPTLSTLSRLSLRASGSSSGDGFDLDWLAVYSREQSVEPAMVNIVPPPPNIDYTSNATVRRNDVNASIGSGESGNAKIVSTTVELSTGAAGTTYKLSRVPSSARISGLSKIYWDDLATSGSPDLDVGLGSVKSNITSDPDALNDGLDASATGSSSLVKDRANYGKKAWEFVSGQTNDPGGELDIYVTTTTAAINQAGTVTLDLVYTLD